MKNFFKSRKMKTILGGKYSSWKEVTSGVLQSSVLAPIMFLVHSYVDMLADDVKIQRIIISGDSCLTLWCNGSTLGSQPRGPGFDPQVEW